jgi:hypothetical protein
LESSLRQNNMLKNKINHLEKFQKYSKEKISILGTSIEFDWFVVVVFSFLLLIFTMIFSIFEIRNIENYVPVDVEEKNFFIEQSRVIDKSVEIISFFEQKVDK